MRVRAAALVCLLAASVALTGCGGKDVPAGAARTDAVGAEVKPEVQGEASCVAPYLDDRPPTTPPRPHTLVVAAGSTFRLHGHAFFRGCNDTGGGEIGTALPPVGMRITYADGRWVDLGPFMPEGPDFSFATDVDVPRDAAAGVATAYAGTATFEFTVRR
jgi:hypothetical protein